MAKPKSFVTEDEFEKIRIMRPLSIDAIARVTGRSKTTIKRIMDAWDWEDYQDIKRNTHTTSEPKAEEPASNPPVQGKAEPTFVQPRITDDVLIEMLQEARLNTSQTKAMFEETRLNNTMTRGLLERADKVIKLFEQMLGDAQ